MFYLYHRLSFGSVRDLCEAMFDSGISRTGYLETFLKIEDIECTLDQAFSSSGVPVCLPEAQEKKNLYGTPAVWN